MGCSDCIYWKAAAKDGKRVKDDTSGYCTEGPPIDDYKWSLTHAEDDCGSMIPSKVVK